MQKNWLKLTAVAAVLALTGAAQASVIHDDGFVDFGGSSNGARDYRSVGSFNVNYTVNQIRTAAISFDFFGSKSVDGSNAWQDNYYFALNGVTLFEGTFALGGGGDSVAFTNTNGFSWNATSSGLWQGGKVAVVGMIDLADGLNEFTFGFTSPGPNNGGSQGLGDEGWGVNNVNLEVAPVPVPAALPLLAGAIAGLGALGLRRRRARA